MNHYLPKTTVYFAQMVKEKRELYMKTLLSNETEDLREYTTVKRKVTKSKNNL